MKDEETFLLFVQSLIADRVPHERRAADGAGFSGDWANNSISEFLEAAVAWAEASDFGVRHEPDLATNKWKQFAVFLYCGKIYE
ncbi:DUF7660 family protein [Permianibacter fluminis]|uniref:DUF7660 family protein n=1 Tax=Permianibacter fluminis TaxID=2738515 RepID=UPI002E2BB45C|nr:hypothetical protein [Permianibacter fluminis]